MSGSVEDFYAALADNFHLIYADWDRSIRRQGEVLDSIIRPRLDSWPLSVLDCSCGIGTQAIGLAQRGYSVHATDLSPAMVARAEREAEKRGAHLRLGVADMRTLRAQLDGTFDFVICCDNAFPQLLTDEDMLLAAQNMRDMLRGGGWVLVSIRDYDLARTQRPASEGPRVLDGPDGRRVVLQVWDWSDDGRFYTVHQFLLLQSGDTWHVQHSSTRYQALLRDEMDRVLRSAGFQKVEWLHPADTGYHQPIVVAQTNPTSSSSPTSRTL